MSVEAFRAIQGKQKPNKYRNKRVVVDGWPFDSNLEADRYEQLKLLQKIGTVGWFLCQVPFRLPGGIIYRADFLVVWHYAQSVRTVQYRETLVTFDSHGSNFVTIEDCKGADTRVSINKRKQVEAIYGITVTLIKRR